MFYYGIEFPNYTTLVVKSSVATIDTIIEGLSHSKGIHGPDGNIYNPRHYIRVYPISEPGPQHIRVAKSLSSFFLKEDKYE